MGPAARIGLAVAGAAGFILGRRMRVSGDSCPELRHLIETLPHCHGLNETLCCIERAFSRAFGFPAAIFLLEGGELFVRHRSPRFQPECDEIGGAQEAVRSGTPVKRDLPNEAGSLYFLPLKTWKGVLGVLEFQADPLHLAAPQCRMIDAFRNQLSLLVLRAAFQDEARTANVLSETDKFQKALLNSIAHNVRTPLASIIGVLSTLQEDQAVLNHAVRTELVDTAREEAERLNRLLTNLLGISRLEAGALKIRTDPCDVQDVIGAALEQLGIRNREIRINLPQDLPVLRMDFVLIVQVLVNLLDNAVKYSPAETPVNIDAVREPDAVVIAVSDEGDGIPETDLVRVFEKFHRAGRSGETGGVGLGLSICKGLVEAHGGKIWAERRGVRGTSIRFRLPFECPARMD